MSLDSQNLLSHIVSQTRANIEFLRSIQQLSEPDAQLILAKLPPVSQSRDLMAGLTTQTQNLAIAPVPLARAASQTTGPPPRYGKALWDYSGDPNDLAFRAGDVIEIVEETNADWFTGRLNGRQALFPANYIERLPVAQAPMAEQTAPYNAYPSPVSNYSSPPPQNNYSTPQNNYSSPPPQHNYSSLPLQNNYSSPPPQNSYSSPPPNNGYQPQQYNQQYNAPPPPQQEVVQAQAPVKSSKVSGLKNTLMHSAVGGVGLGAGSAVGSGIINSIF